MIYETCCDRLSNSPSVVCNARNNGTMKIIAFVDNNTIFQTIYNYLYLLRSVSSNLDDRTNNFTYGKKFFFSFEISSKHLPIVGDAIRRSSAGPAIFGPFIGHMRRMVMEPSSGVFRN